MRLAANLSFNFTDIPFLERFSAAAQAGLGGVEYLFPYDHSPEVLASELQRHQLRQVLFNLPPGDWQQGERGLAAVPGRETEFRHTVDEALRYALALNCTTLHCMAGIVTDFDREQARQTYIANLQHACGRVREAGITITIEPLNERDMPGYFLMLPDEARNIIEAVGAENLGLQFDLYHAQITHGDIVRTIEKHAGIIRHVQIAGVPKRNLPDHGELNVPLVFAALVANGYDGWIGCEYTADTIEEDPFLWAHTLKEIER